ncbi:neutral zinc metallopeptidase [Frigidibacter albus]|uniref:Neutral zinc metallopeptidase n=1 Tax=Frigidibacter albus TaxID=1465486 RepID=A0A6L8VGM9_9RHOB|nr:metallopeptidase family protein [Frigidibacter albus]MZQ89455.1 neutral zinc metallopeptidase [Frigidibacter albus]NBE31361.1 neutral zinc metallopeptidase [Frigidibacter albus]GGH54230.1 neutral zinc metallopeptidase [Frigidibacter albus]
MDEWKARSAPGIEVIEALAQAAVAALPPQFAAAAGAVAIRVEDFPPDEFMEELDLNDPFELSGLYEGIPMTEKSVMDQPMRPDTVWLFRRPILDEWCERGNVSLGDLVAHVTVHEFAHHFGWSDEEIAAIDKWWE